MTKTFSTKTAAETQELAKQLLLDIVNKKVVLLHGQLGSGKTTFVKGLARALGITETIKSPTYTYVNTYEVKKQGNKEKKDSIISLFPRFLVHFDLYRLPEHSEHPEQTAASIGLEDALNDPHAIIVIEWPERLRILKPNLSLKFIKKNNNHHISVREQLH